MGIDDSRADDIHEEWETLEEKHFGRYRIIEEIGRGGMGKVYRAHDPQLERTVALKLIISGERGNTERFLREARATASLKHPNIVTIYDIGVEAGRPFFAMDYIEGESLQSLMKKDVLRIPQIVDIMIKVGNAVAHTHAHGIVHRDLKPANVMLGKDNEPKVMDFGLAKMSKASKKLSKTGMLIGTLQYMPPEQTQGNLRGIDARSDVYALGAILYEMLTKRPLFSGTAFNIVFQILNKDPVPPREIDDRIPKDLERVCLKALEKNKIHRYQTAGAFVEDLKLYARGKPVKARPLRFWERTWRTVKKHRVRVVASLLLCSILVLGGTGLRGYIRQRDHEQLVLQAKLFLEKRDARAEEYCRRAMRIKNTRELRTLLHRARGYTLFSEGRQLEQREELREAFRKYLEATSYIQDEELGRNLESIVRKLGKEHDGFTRTGNMNQARYYYTATLLPTGKILIAGGHDPSRTVYDSAEIYDPDSGKFAATGSMILPRVCHTQTLLSDGRVLITGGSTPVIRGDNSRQHTTKSAEIYDSATGKFIEIASMKFSRKFHSATLLPDGRVMVAGGWSGNKVEKNFSGVFLNSAEIYDPRTGVFSICCGLKIPRQRHTATLLDDGRVLITGGTHEEGRKTDVLKDAEIYDPEKDSFRPVSPMRDGRFSHISVSLANGKLLVAGGSADKQWTPIASAEIYDPVTEVFQAVSPMNHARWGGGATLLPDGTVLFSGGVRNEHACAAEVYDPKLCTFRPVSSSVSFYYKVGHTSILLRDGNVLIVEGFNGKCALYSGLDVEPERRPAISAVAHKSLFPVGVAFGATVEITGKNFARGATEVVLLAMSGVTARGSTTGSRYCTLSVRESTSTSMKVEFPSGRSDPKGYYLMFAMVYGIQSEGKILRLE